MFVDDNDGNCTSLKIVPANKNIYSKVHLIFFEEFVDRLLTSTLLYLGIY